MISNRANKVLFIGLVWPEPTSSAAGYRILQLMNSFLDKGYEVHFASSAQRTLRSFVFPQIVTTHDILLNHNSFDEFINRLSPDVVVYDRFMIEEQYGWRVRSICPNAITILDTEDLHFVRKAREIAFKKNLPIDYNTDDAKRELASVLRCDISLIISKGEEKILRDFLIPEHKWVYLPFIEHKILRQDFEKLPSFSQRKGFCFIGNFMHQPNYHTVLLLKNVYWDMIKRALPDANIYIYGAYPTQKIFDLHNPKQGFYIKGSVDRVEEALYLHRVLLAPIAFGAGIKGKFVDAAKCKIPCVSTSVGAESMQIDLWNGLVADSVEDFVAMAVQLYNDEVQWNILTQNGMQLINGYYANNRFVESFFLRLNDVSKDIVAHRMRYFLGEILFQQQMQASKYLSLWIMEKNK